MNERDTPPVAAPSIGAEQAQRCIDAYIDAWNEPQADKRRQILAQAMTEDGAYADPAKKTDSRADLVECIGDALEKDPGRRIVRTSEVDAHNLVCRFNWRSVKADGTQAPESVDFIEFATDGRIRRVTGFFGPLTPNEAQCEVWSRSDAIPLRNERSTDLLLNSGGHLGVAVDGLGLRGKLARRQRSLSPLAGPRTGDRKGDDNWIASFTLVGRRTASLQSGEKQVRARVWP
jgi:hypothetical protein